MCQQAQLPLALPRVLAVNKMSKYKQYILFISLISLGLIAIFVVSYGYYPILSVNGSFVSARTFWKNYQAGAIYYDFLRKNYKDDFKNNKVLSDIDIKRSVLTQLVEDELVESEIKKELGKDLDYLVKNKIESINQDQKIKLTAQAAYGLNLADFEKIILTPMAKSELLTGRLFLKGEKLETWLAEAKKNSDVKIYSRNFYWDGTEVKAAE